MSLFDRASQHAEKAGSEFAAASRASKADRDRLARLQKGRSLPFHPPLLAIVLYRFYLSHLSAPLKIWTDIATGRAKSRAKAFLSSLAPVDASAQAHAKEPTAQTKESKDTTTQAHGKRSLVNGLNNFDSSFLADKNLIDFPPNLEAIRMSSSSLSSLFPLPLCRPSLTCIACKPLLFDLALNDCTFPNLEARKKAASQKGGGFFGFFSRS